MIDPTTGRQVWTGPNGEAGSASPFPGATPSVVNGQTVYFIPGQNIQNGNRIALGLPPISSATSTAPGANAGVVQGFIDTAMKAEKTTPQRVDFATQARLLYPYLAEPILNDFIANWEQYGDPNLALSKTRQSAIYDQYYAGNKRPDGSVRLSEAQYASNVEGYNRRRAQFGMSPLAADKVKALIEGDTAPDEYGQRLDRAYLGLVSNIPQVRDYYSANFGASGLTDSALFESVVDGGSPLEVQKRITAAQVGGEAKVRGFDLSKQEAERLTSFGLDQQASRTLFGQAQSELPKLNDLIGRHNDPNDPFTLDSFSEAIVLNDPEELARIGRLYNQERSLYSGGNLFARDQQGGLTGLLDR